MNSVRWETAPFSSIQANSPFLLRYTFTDEHYSIDVTDLSTLWSCQSSKAQILRKAEEDGASIDPSQDDTQLKLLLEKLCSAFEGARETTVRVTTLENSSLQLHITCLLPEPFQPLVWTLLLLSNPPEKMRSDVILPLMSLSLLQKQRIDQLYSLLHAKDDAVAKVFDKLESGNVDLASLFPGVTLTRVGSTKKGREQVMRHVKGLSRFQEQAWPAVIGDLQVAAMVAETEIGNAFAGAESNKAQQLAKTMTSSSDVMHGPQTSGTAVGRTELVRKVSIQDATEFEVGLQEVWNLLDITTNHVNG